MANLTDVTGVSETRAENLRDEGFTTVDDVAEADPSDLEEVHGVGEATATDLVEAAQEVITAEHTDEGDEAEDDGEDREDVGLEDLEEVNEGTPEGYNEPVEPEDEGEDEVEAAEEVDGPEEYEVELEVANDEQYDYFLKAILDMKLERSNNPQASQSIMAEAVEVLRPLGGAGTVELTVSDNELNRLHSAVQQAETRHQQNRQNDAFEEMRDLKRRVDELRSEYIF